MSFEVEQKFAVSDSAGVEQSLVRQGAESAETSVQVDRYYGHPCRDFAATDEAIRIRTVGDENFFTYKGPKLDATTKTRREIELPVGQGHSAIQRAEEFLDSLGFRFVAEVRKQRRRLVLRWKEREVEIALDRVEGLGDFAELELIAAKPSEIPAAQECLQSLAASLNLTTSERRSYLELLLARRSASKEDSANPPEVQTPAKKPRGM